MSEYTIILLIFLFAVACITVSQASSDLKDIAHFNLGEKKRKSYTFKVLTKDNCKRITVYTHIAFYTALATTVFCLVSCIIMLMNLKNI